MSDLLLPGIGSSLWVCATPPTTPNLAGYQGLTWIKVGHLEDIPEYGPESSVVTFTPLETGIVAKYHGEENNGSLTVPVGFVQDDTGQVVLETARVNKARIAFKIRRSNATADFFQGKVFSSRKGKNLGSVIVRNFNIEIETTIIAGPESAS